MLGVLGLELTHFWPVFGVLGLDSAHFGPNWRFWALLWAIFGPISEVRGLDLAILVP